MYNLFRHSPYYHFLVLSSSLVLNSVPYPFLTPFPFLDCTSSPYLDCASFLTSNPSFFHCSQLHSLSHFLLMNFHHYPTPLLASVLSSLLIGSIYLI